MTAGSNETNQLRHSRQRQNQRKRRRLYRFCQRVIVVVGFWCSGIFLVTNLSVVDNHSSRVLVLPSSSKTTFANSLLASWWFLDTTMEQQQDKDDKGLYAATTLERIERECRTSVEVVTNEKKAYKLNLETTQKSLQEQLQQTNNLVEKYNSERTNFKALQREKENGIALIQELRRQSETLAANLEVEQLQRRELEETIGELQNEIVIMTQRESQNNTATSCTLTTTTTTTTMMDENGNVQRGIEEDANKKNELKKMAEFGIFKTTRREKQKHEIEEQLNKEYQSQQRQQLRKNSEAILIEHLDAKTLGENISLIEEDQLIAESVLLTSQNGMQSIHNVFLKSAMADKGPVLPKVYRQITKHFLPPFGIDGMYERGGSTGFSHRVQDFTGSIKEGIKHNVKNIVGVRRQLGNDVDKVDPPEIDRLTRTRETLSNIGHLAMKEAESIGKATLHTTENFIEKLAAPMQFKDFAFLKENLKEEVSNAFGNIAQSIPQLVDNTKVITDKLKNSTDKVIKHGKEGSEIIRRQVKKNVDEVSISGIGKLDRGQEAITVISDFALAKLESVGKRALHFAEEWRQARSRRSHEQVRKVNST